MSEDDYGHCPNCSSMVNVDEMGEENGKVCCKNCYEEERIKQAERQQLHTKIKEVISKLERFEPNEYAGMNVLSNYPNRDEKFFEFILLSDLSTAIDKIMEEVWIARKC